MSQKFYFLNSVCKDDTCCESTIIIYKTLEEVYTYLEIHYKDELDAVSNSKVFNRSEFIRMYNEGGVKLNYDWWIHLTYGSVGDEVQFHELTELHENTPVQPDILKEYEDQKTSENKVATEIVEVPIEARVDQNLPGYYIEKK